MEKIKLGKVFILFTYSHVIGVMCQSPLSVGTWFNNLNILTAPKSLTLQFYAQDIVTGPGQTTYEIARSSISATSPTSFGILYMVDNQLNTGPDPNSPRVGRRQGLVGFSDLNELALYLSFNFVFQGGLYNGSTISVIGRSRIASTERELSIVGGTGVFRLARGVVIYTTYSFNSTTNNSVFKYTLYITYY
ncbi:dirigent protein 1-like [Dorcoceras hygrometricum]|uniref:Dirigent protein n=1 Tax=Dorcoceras hygrometricum TaxID=472368 RepID=A0A2Z7D8X6_9LAMI|nr:dirigent protein 1-like [Dorcoceras hygrometricum]